MNALHSSLLSIALLCGTPAHVVSAPVASVPIVSAPAAANTAAAEDQFAQDVMLHVVLHELAHALVREFDLPILGNEETLADAFATHYLTTHLPDRAPDVITARVRSLMIEANEVPRDEWTVRGEHDNDARRAFQITALALAADRDTYTALAESIGMSERDINGACDYGTEIHRSWRRILTPLWMPHGMASNEVRLSIDPSSDLLRRLCTDTLAPDLERIIRQFDWHSQVTLRFEEGDGTAAWNRSRRTITVKSGYFERFLAQGRLVGDSEKE